jgi:hypothetical protein
MFVVVYRWRLKPGFEATHRAGWRAVTEAIRRAYATGGSRLHRDADGAWIAYAVWPDEETYQRAQQAAPVAADADRALMREGIEGSIEVLHRMTVVDDLLSGPLSPR